jgi:two-component system, sensor histidine kinase and response regulator
VNTDDPSTSPDAADDEVTSDSLFVPLPSDQPPVNDQPLSDQDLPDWAIANLSMANYRSLVESLPLFLLIKDAEGRRLYANQAYLRYRNMKAEELLGKRDEDLFSPEIAARYREDDLQVMRTGQPLQGIEQTQSAAGELHWVERFKCPLRDPEGNICGVQLLFWDVTARVRAERLRDQERQWLQTLLDNMPDSIYFKDENSRFIRVGAGMANKFGLPNSDAVIGLTDADVFTPEHAEPARQDELKIMRTGKPVINRIERETWPDREDTWCSSTKLPLRDTTGKIIGTFGISRDITHLKKVQDELARARDAANEANRAKSDFLANMSHEIRTPMNAIIGMSELLSQTPLSREQRDFLDLVREAADSLLRLLNDILDFSKIEASKMELESIPFSLRDCVGKTGHTLSLRAAQKGLELICRVAPDIPDRLIGDPGRLRQILINLIGNSIKFTETGEVFVNVWRDPGDRPQAQPEGTAGDGSDSTDRPLRLRFSVRDTGIGIPEDKQAHVFEAFSQADTSTTRRYGGTGLGLTISAQLAKLMGGEFWLESEVGVGTTFYFTAEFGVATQQCMVQTGALTTLTDLPVLVVDDNATNRRILQEVFTAWRLRPTLVASGPLALEELDRAANRGEPYRLAILDCMMPEMDGFELAERIRSQFDDRKLRLIILSSAARLGDSEQCQRVGVSRYLTKPVIQSELLDAVLQVMQIVDVEVPQERTSFPACPKMKVLLAEDGLANQVVARGLLKAAGHEVVIAADGRQAIDLWTSEPFDVILMDMHMPHVDGLEATREIRRLESERGLRPTPIVAITAAAMSEDTRLCLEAGMDAFLSKPVQGNLLYETLATLADRIGKTPTAQASEPPAQAAAEEAGAAPVAMPPSALAGSEPASEDVINLPEAMRRIPGGLPAMRRLAEVFLQECESLMTKLEEAIAQADMRQVQYVTHTLKGSAKLFLASRISSTAFEMERAAKANRTADLPRLLAVLREDETQVRSSLNRFLGSEDLGPT